MECPETFRQELIASLPHLRAYALKLTRSADQANDLVQDATERLLKAHAQYTPGTNFRAWAIATLKNRFIDLRRRARFHGGSIDDLPDNVFATRASQEDCLRLEDANRCFNKLTPAHRQILRVMLAGHTYESASRLFDCPIGTIRSRLARARATLAGLLDGLSLREAEKMVGTYMSRLSDMFEENSQPPA